MICSRKRRQIDRHLIVRCHATMRLTAEAAVSLWHATHLGTCYIRPTQQ